MKLRLLSLLALATMLYACESTPTQSEKKEITLEDIFKNGSFATKGIGTIRWMNDGRYYSAREEQDGKTMLVRKDITTGETVETLVTSDELGFGFSDYTFSEDEQRVMFSTETEKIYRRSSKSVFHVYDLKSKQLQTLAKGAKVLYASFSPNGDKAAYVRDNNLYMVDLGNMRERQITKDGKWNHIINGNADWVYEEEFSMSQAFQWSPDGQKIAFWRFDESRVKEYNMQMWGDLYPEDYKFKYPKAGEENSIVQIKVYNLRNGRTRTMDIGSNTNIYIPRIFWTRDNNVLSMMRLNRLQNRMDLLHANVNNGNSEVVYTEESNTYLEYENGLTYLADNQSFILTSEKSGYNHLYHYGTDGKLIKQITNGNWEVSGLSGVDETNGKIYFTSAEKSPLERHLYSVGLDGSGKAEMTSESATHRINWSPDFKYYIQTASSASHANVITLKEGSGKEVRVMEDNAEAMANIGEFDVPEKEFFSFNTPEGVELNGYMLKPSNFDPNKKYPVLMYVYGGPGSQTVQNSWNSSRDYWLMHLVNQGYIVASVDNRGTGARGKEFKHITYKTLGKYEVQDQIDAGKYLAGLPYTDPDRIGIWGWSYGGYMSSLSLFIGNDVFKTAIAVAPVTNWRFYDTVYTERYMSTPMLNDEGYDAFSPVTHVDKLKGNFMLIHGTGDDNVHFQNSVEMVNKLVEADKQFESFYYPNRAHGMRGGNATWHLYNKMTDFILRKL